MWAAATAVVATAAEAATDMFRISLIASLAAVALFAYAQARGLDPLELFAGSHNSSPTSGGRSVYHK